MYSIGNSIRSAILNSKEFTVIASSVAAFVVSSALLLTVGFLLGFCFGKKQKARTKQLQLSTPMNQLGILFMTVTDDPALEGTIMPWFPQKCLCKGKSDYLEAVIRDHSLLNKSIFISGCGFIDHCIYFEFSSVLLHRLCLWLGWSQV